MKSSRRQAKKAAKAKLSGAISTSNSTNNKKIVFGDDDDSVDAESQLLDDGSANVDDNFEGKDGDDDDDDDAVEEVKGSAARESTQRTREAERKVVKEKSLKKKRKKKKGVSLDEDAENINDEDDKDLLTEDFFKMVDFERADQLQKAKKQKKVQKAMQKKMLGKHTTFIVEDEYKMTNVPQKIDQNIEVVALGGGDSNDETNDKSAEEREILLSATLGSKPSKAAIAFARGSMTSGTAKERSSESRKRKSKNEETWKRSRKFNNLGIGSRPGHAAALFVRKR